jgi:ParB-like chromosome segregation protein Spo0J
MKVQIISISSIRRDFQDAECLFDEKVAEIAAALLRGDTLPPIVVRYDGETYLLQDGFHRIAAMLSIGRKEAEAEIIPGNRADMDAEFVQMLAEIRASLREGMGD